MKKYILFNFKNNPQTITRLKELIKIYRLFDKKTLSRFQIVLLPPDIYLSETKQALTSGFSFGAQNVFWFNKIHATGETTPMMLKSLGADIVIIGHFERRNFFQENRQMINLKIKACLDNKLTPVLCVGEKEKTKDELMPDFKIKQAIFEELNYALRGVQLPPTAKLIIAYEPFWAIGKEISQSLNNIQAIASLIRFWLARRFGEKTAKQIPVLYGGSVSHQNIENILSLKNINGVLIGSASVNSIKLKKILKLVEKK